MDLKKKMYLEFVRGFAAIIVLLFHYNEFFAEKFSSHLFFSNMGKDAVMIFFILSGCVINISQTRKPKNRIQFLSNRFLRLYPQFIVGVLSGLLVIYILKMDFPSLGKILGNVFMLSTLQGYIVHCIKTNSPVWSLSFEMFFYLVFAITIGKHQKRMMQIWFLISLAVLPLYYYKMQVNVAGHFIAMFAYSSIWILGYYIYEYRNYFYSDVYAAILSVGLLPLVSRLHISGQYYDPLKYLLFAIAAVPFYRYCLQLPSSGKKINILVMMPFYALIGALLFFISDSMLLSKIIYASIPLILVAIVFLAKKMGLNYKIVSLVNRIGATTGKYSYSIYIIHYPILFLFANSLKSARLFVIVSLFFVILVSFLMETYLQPFAANFFGEMKTNKP